MDHLTTHAVCLGMTGSGKTGLGIVALEELARRRVPLLVIDLKGDMVDLLLNFPDLDAGRRSRRGSRRTRSGTGTRLQVAREAGREVERRSRSIGSRTDRCGGGQAAGSSGSCFTPGVASVAPLDILPALSAPAGWDPARRSRRRHRPGQRRRRRACSPLIGRGGDPLSDRDHVLTASVILEHWTRGDVLDLTGLLTSLADPPIEVLGALPDGCVLPARRADEVGHGAQHPARQPGVRRLDQGDAADHGGPAGDTGSAARHHRLGGPSR